MCELQDIFNGVSLDAGRPCQQYLEIEYYTFSYYGALSNDTVIKDQVLRMKDRYRIKYNREQRTNREWYVEFEKYLAEMEKYGIKCISSRNILKDREHLVIYDDIPCKNYTQIHFYADRISLKAFSIFNKVDLNDYESVSFTLFPFIKDTVRIEEIRLPGTYWTYELYKKQDKRKK